MFWAQALLALLVNLALLGLVAKIIMLNDVLGTVSQPTGARLLRLRKVASKRERWGTDRWVWAAGDPSVARDADAAVRDRHDQR